MTRPDTHLPAPDLLPRRGANPEPPGEPTDLPDNDATALADIVAGLLGLFVAALALLVASGWLTSTWGAGVLTVLLVCPLALVLVALWWH